MALHHFDICYVLSHGFAARMLLQTGLIKRLADDGLKIAIISPDSKDGNWQAIRSHKNIEIFDGNIRQRMRDDNYNFKRPYYLEDLKSNPVFWEKHLYSIFYSTSKHPWRRIRPFYYYLIFQLIKIFPSIRQRFRERESRYLESSKASQLIQQIRPRLLVSTYPVNFLEAKMLYAARKEDVETMIHLLSWDNITSKGIFPAKADHYIVWGPIMYQELKSYYGVKDEQVDICGVPHFDHHLQVAQRPAYAVLLQQLGLQPKQPYLFVAMSSPRFAPKEIDIVEWLATAIQQNVFGPEMQLVVRPHPQNVQGSMSDQSWIKRLDRLNSKRVAIDYPQLNDRSKVRWSMKKEDMDHLSNLLLGCSVCLNSGSTVSIDALVLDKPVILTAFDGAASLNYWKSARRLIDYPHQKKFIALGGVRIARDYSSLQSTIEQYLAQPKLDQEKRAYAIEQECYRNDGKSSERVLEAMKNKLALLSGYSNADA